MSHREDSEEHRRSSIADLQFVQSEGVNIVLYASQAGWIAWAHAALDLSQRCALYSGAGLTPSFAGVEFWEPGQIVCTE
ncbi:MAG TPA: hypothetical protein EYQ64_07545 [Gemmatimonadetes bacterium]|nr:hypothetical protein [Gemmatimonadota bacterium]